jgi:periplasmic protein TonB
MTMRTVSLLLTALALTAARVSAQEGTYEITAVEERPAVSNLAVVRRAMEREYPDSLRAVGQGGTTVIGMEVDPRGRPRNVRVARSSGDARLDSAAVRVGAAIRFRPARVGGRAVATGLQLPLTFTPPVPVADPPGPGRVPRR